MPYFTIQGGKPLRGTVTLSGAKNAATKMMVASLLTDKPVVLTNYPEIGDTAIVEELVERIGARIEKSKGSIQLHTPEVKTAKVQKLSRRNRIPILALGPLLHRVGEAEVPILGGDKIGPRPVDLHIKALTLLGARVHETEQGYRAEAPDGLRGAHISFSFPSVGATETAIFAAVCAHGETVIENAAAEPEVDSVIEMLQKMGAIIAREGFHTIHIEGVERLRGVTHHIIPDRNEAASFAALALATKGDILVKEALQRHLFSLLNNVRRIGGEYRVEEQGIRFYVPNDELAATLIQTRPHPGFMTDWQQPFAVALTQASGASEVHETIYEDRFGYAEDLNNMGANIEVFTDCGNRRTCRFANREFYHQAIINGPTILHGAELEVRDLRSGMAHVIAALVADGTSTIHGIEELDRGYVALDKRLQGLGAEIHRESNTG